MNILQSLPWAFSQYPSWPEGPKPGSRAKTFNLICSVDTTPRKSEEGGGPYTSTSPIRQSIDDAVT